MRLVAYVEEDTRAWQQGEHCLDVKLLFLCWRIVVILPSASTVNCNTRKNGVLIRSHQPPLHSLSEPLADIVAAVVRLTGSEERKLSFHSPLQGKSPPGNVVVNMQTSLLTYFFSRSYDVMKSRAYFVLNIFEQIF